MMMCEKVFSAALFDELEKIYPDTVCRDGKSSVQVCAAAGTYPGVQIMLNDLTPGQSVSFRVRVKNRLEEAKNWKLFSMQAVPVEFNTAVHDRTELMWKEDYNTHVIRRAPFTVYDVLKPIVNIETVQYTSQAYLFRCLSQAQENRRTAFELEITHCGVTRKLDFVVDEFRTAVPEIGRDTQKYVNWFSLKNIAEYHHVPMWGPQFEEILYRHYRAAAYTRQNMLAIDLTDVLELDGAGRHRLNEQKLDTIIRLAEKAGMYWIEGSAVARRKDNEWGATEAEACTDRKIIPGAGEESLREIGRLLNDYIRSRNLQERWMQSVLDEPSNELQNAYRAATDIIKKEMPGIPILEPTIGADALVGTVDVWCPPLNIFEKKLDFFRERVEAGDRIFVYSCLNPGGAYCNRLLDMETIRQVYIGWGCAAYPFVEGFLHWGGNKYCGRDPYEQTCQMFTCDDYDYTQNMDGVLPAGDGFIFYPGRFGQVYSSVRAEGHRIGLEDLELLRQAKKKDPQFTRDLICRLFRNFRDYETDIGRYRQVKRQLLEFLSE